MYSVPPARAWWLAVGPRLERGVRQRNSQQTRRWLPRSAVALNQGEEDAALPEPRTLLPIVFEPPRDQLEGANMARPAAAPQTDFQDASHSARLSCFPLRAANACGPRLWILLATTRGIDDLTTKFSIFNECREACFVFPGIAPVLTLADPRR